MEPTRRLWAVAALAAGLAVFGVVLARPLALAGTVLVGAWLVSRQYLFARAMADLTDNLSLSQSPAQIGVRTNESVPVTLSATLEAPSRLACRIRGGLPTAVVAEGSPDVSLDPGTTTATVTVDARWPIAGRHTFDRATLVATDGLFREHVPVGATPTVTVEPRGPRNLHVGEGGERIATAYGEHDAGRFGSGLEPAELREYVPGDAADRIDWNATARLGEPYVREFDAETDRTTMVVMDHREALSRGRDGETELDYLREVALAVADSARRVGDPLGLVSVGDDGVTNRFEPTTAADRYETVRRTILELEPTTATDARIDERASTRTDVDGANAYRPRTARRRAQTKTLADVRQTLAALEGQDDALARTVRPFYADRDPYLELFDSQPLYRAVRTTVAREQGRVFTVLCTDDSAPAELRETVKLASQEGGSVLVLLAPSVLYEAGGLTDVDRAYEWYVEFEDLRRELARLEGVTALEVGPGDRLSTVLAAGRGRTARGPAGGGHS